jgi:hypothetical protein
VCAALGAISCVASLDGESAGAFGAGKAPVGATSRAGAADLLVARDPSGKTDLTFAVTLPHPPGEGQVELLDLVVAATAAIVER